MNAQEPLIRFNGVTKRFGDFTAIDAVDLTIYRQEFFALLGPSGCGKTTLMRLLAGFEETSSGTITIDGYDMAGVPPSKRPVNMMFQSYALFPHLSVADNIAFGLKRSPMPKSKIKGRVDEMLHLVQLENLAARKPHQISGGQRQRVALARALAKSPKLLLLDEPLAALDKKLRQKTQFELVNIQEKLGTTFVIITHDQEEAMTVADRIAVMDAGKIVQTGTPETIYESPNSTYVAHFIGDVNMIAGMVQGIAAGRASLQWAEGMPLLSAIAGKELRNNSPATLVVRPEKILISKEEPHNGVNKLRGTVLDIAYLGNVSTYHVTSVDGKIIKAQMTNQQRIAHHDITWDDTVWLSWDEAAGIILES